MEIQEKDIPEEIKEFEALCERAKKLESENYQKSLEAFGRALTVAEEARNSKWIAKAQEGKARSLWKLSDFSQSQIVYRQALDNYRTSADLYGAARCHCGLGIIAGELTEYALALDCFENALAAARKAKQDTFSAVLVGNIGNIYFHMGRYADAERCFRQSLDHVTQMGRKDLMGQMYSGLASVMTCEGRYSEALDHLSQCKRWYEECDDSFGVAIALFNTALVHKKRSKLKEAEREFLRTVEYTKSLDMLTLYYKAHGELSQIYTELENPEKALHHLNLHMDGNQDVKKEMVKRQLEKLNQFDVKQ